jgi:hypothetical protein
MSSVINDFLSGLTKGSYMRDYKHASKIFVSDNYALSPKYSFLFHVAFGVVGSLSRLPTTELLQLGLMVKTVSLPKFQIETKTLNAYNRTNIIQNKIKYDPVTITFHDDSADVVRDFWYDYMSHYYRDSDYGDSDTDESKYYAPSKYEATQQIPRWGYLPAKYNNNGSQERILNNIKIYSLHQKRFTEYILINPTITGFQHGQHSQSETTGLMENTMTVSFETVLYKYGTVKIGGEPTGFATLDYDKQPSPLSPGGSGTASILGPGGLLDSASGVSQAVGSNNYLGAGLIAAQSYTKLKGQNLGAMAGTELKSLGLSIISGDNNALNRLALPKAQNANGRDSIVPTGLD